MNKTDARKIAETITNEQLQQMFETAKEKITDWKQVSTVNNSFTKGVAWNMLAKDFNVNYGYHILSKTNMVREFGEFLPGEFKIKKEKKQFPTPVHQKPIF